MIDMVVRILFLFCLLIITKSQKIIDRWDTDFNVYWNIPTFQCASHKVFFDELVKRYNIIQNYNDTFRGDKHAILYDPGNFPAILAIQGTDKHLLRNGGVPQEGNLTLHLEIFTERIEELIPDKLFSGVGVIDFESWRPIFRQNFGNLLPYKKLSIDIEKQRHPFRPDTFIQQEAIRRFELFGRIYMERTLNLAKQLRPLAQWGYYAYPYCFNMSPNSMNTNCPAEVEKENDRINWLFEESDVLFPSLYLSEKRLNEANRVQLIEGRIIETERIVKNLANSPKIMPYFWFKYQDSNNFLSKIDLRNAFVILKSFKLDGVILWGSSNDVNTKKKCKDLYIYIRDVLGPIINSSYYK